MREEKLLQSFERWMIALGCHFPITRKAENPSGIIYENEFTQVAWLGFRAGVDVGFSRSVINEHRDVLSALKDR